MSRLAHVCVKFLIVSLWGASCHEYASNRASLWRIVRRLTPLGHARGEVASLKRSPSQKQSNRCDSPTFYSCIEWRWMTLSTRKVSRCRSLNEGARPTGIGRTNRPTSEEVRTPTYPPSVSRSGAGAPRRRRGSCARASGLGIGCTTPRAQSQAVVGAACPSPQGQAGPAVPVGFGGRPGCRGLRA